MTQYRDYTTEMQGVIDSATSGGPYTPRVVAHEIFVKLTVVDPELLRGWLWENAERIIWQTVNDRDRAKRSATLGQARRKFRDATNAHAAGDSAPLLRFTRIPFTIEDGSRPCLGALTRADLLFVSGTYRKRQEENAMTATFLEMLAKRIGDGIVSDYFTDEQLEAMFNSISG